MAPPASTSIGIFCKHPAPGKVKTRLAQTVGTDTATAIYAAMLDETVRVARASGLPVTLWISPAEERDWFSAQYPGLDLQVQAGGDLGERLAAAAIHHSELDQGWILIGSDCPGVTAELLQQAASVLRTADLLLGPSTDGGYWLIGGKEALPEVWDDMPWSTPELFQQTLDTAGSLHLRVTTLPQLADLDTVQDLRSCAQAGMLSYLPPNLRNL